jgi:hypothetical protein
MKLGMIAAAAEISLAGVSAASAQVYVAEPYVGGTYVAGPIYAAPPPVYAAPPVVVGEPVYVAPAPVGGYVQPRYSYTINAPRYGTIYTTYREPRCAIGADGYRYCN